MKNYDHTKIEKKWRKNWQESNVYQTLPAKKAITKNMKPYYVLDMFPYPSGAGLHVGHPRGYIASDVFARMKRMQGFNVLHPMGFDSFGLPTEQYAIKTGKNPAILSDQLVKSYTEQLSILGFSYDWNRQVATHDPEYYRWTQWIFLQIYNSWYDKVKQKARPIDELEKEFAKNGNTKINAVCDENTPMFSKTGWKNFSDLEKQNMLMKYRLAYEGYAEVNWCEEMGTVLANDEVIEKDGKMVSDRGEFPVVKKQMRQWFMRITAYADRLIDGLATLDWSHSIKEIQKNWIGKSEGSEIEFQIKNHDEKIKVFTTRADTLFGVTYVVLAPEHALVQQLKLQIKNWDAVEKYIASVKSKSDEDRVAAKEKTGIQLQEIYATNPVNGEQVPVWIADYVLANYGTGAVMAVPAHDERDFEFAKKYNLPIKDVIANIFGDILPDTKDVEGSVVIAYDPKKKQFLQLTNLKSNEAWLVGGGREDGENFLESAIRELKEEAGFDTFSKVVKLGSPIISYYFNNLKNSNRKSLGYNYLFFVDSEQQINFTHEEHEAYDTVFLAYEDLYKNISQTTGGVDHWLEALRRAKRFIESNQDVTSIDDGILINSDKFSGMTSEEARKAITEFVGGKLVTKYKMRDAIFARQRYWGEPIPLIHSKDGIISEISEKQLPLKLPNVKSYEPSGNGEGPLATVSAWVKAGYETNTMPGWAGSSWYFLRYADPNNKKSFASKEELDYWFGKNGGVNMYVGGAEHATGHLLYSRFWHKVLKDLGHVKTEEPFQTLRNQGMILGTDGVKMSKRYGNIVNPDDVVKDMGADTMRVYEAFMGPFNATLPWSTDGIAGSRRFIERVWNMQSKVGSVKTTPELEKVIHKTVKKVTEDIMNFSFNTAISAMMICVNEIDKAESIHKNEFKMFLQILAPFAPHVTDELWESLGERKSIHIASWPKYNPKKVIDDTVTIGIQINGKVRSEITIELNASIEQVKQSVLAIPEVIKWINGQEIKKFIYVPGKIISIVI